MESCAAPSRFPYREHRTMMHVMLAENLERYRRKPLTEARRAQMSEMQRARWGAPKGMATVRGVHVLFKHRDALAFWANHFVYHNSPEVARQFVEAQVANNYERMPTITKLYEERLQLREATKEARQIEQEARCVANQNSR